MLTLLSVLTVAADAGRTATDEKATELLEEWERMKTMRNVHFRDHSDPFLATAARFAREERNQDEMAVFQPIKHYIL